MMPTMRRTLDYDWAGTHELPNKDFTCGFCGANITSKTGYTGWLIHGLTQVRQDIYICHVCGNPIFFDVNGYQHPEYKSVRSTFPESVNLVSPRFIEIHRQSQLAEAEDLAEIAGSGYGKALEILIKDYLIKQMPAEADEIKAFSLYNCISQKLVNPQIKALAEKARIIRNDETHYERKYEESDISDLKKLIHACAAWIELESYTREVMDEPEGKVKEQQPQP
jgi:hypothetical protein